MSPLCNREVIVLVDVKKNKNKNNQQNTHVSGLTEKEATELESNPGLPGSIAQAFSIDLSVYVTYDLSYCPSHHLSTSLAPLTHTPTLHGRHVARAGNAKSNKMYLFSSGV